MKTLIALFTLTVCVLHAQTVGQFSIPKYTATGLQYSWLTPSGPKVFGVDAGGNLTLTTPTGGDWSTLTGKPSTFPPSSHDQAISTITGLQAALDDRLTIGMSSVDPAPETIAYRDETGGLYASRYRCMEFGGSYITTLYSGILALEDQATNNVLSVIPPVSLAGNFSVTWPSVGGVMLTANSSLPAANLTGTIEAARLGTGTANSTTYLRGDNTWAAVTSGVTSITGTPNQIAVTGTTTPVLSLPATITGLTSVTSTTFVGGLTGTASGNLALTGGTLTGPLAFSGTTHSGLRFNNLTTTQRDALSGSAAGMAVWNTTTNRLSVHDGAAWTSGFVRLAGDTMTGPLINSTNGAASAPALVVSGVPFAGTGTTSMPLVYLNETGATSPASLSTGGTFLGINANTNTGNFIDCLVDGVSAFNVTKFGAAYFGNNITSTANIQAARYLSQGSYIDGVVGAWPGQWLVYGNGDTSKGATFAFPPRTPAQITANQNNYNPLAGATEVSPRYIRLSTDASRDITGLVFTVATQAGQEHVICNVGSFDVALRHQSASSAAANRFLCSTGADITLSPNQEATLWYDNTTARWRVSKRN